MRAENTSGTKDHRIDERVLRSNQRLLKNFVFNRIYAYYASLAKEEEVTQRVLADRIGMDYGRLNRLLREPSNLTLETISDLLSAMGGTVNDFPIGPSVPEERSSTEFVSDFIGDNSEASDLFVAEDSSEVSEATENVTDMNQYVKKRTTGPRADPIASDRTGGGQYGVA